MTLKSFLEALAISMPFTVGTVDGQGWIVYHDGEHEREVPNWIADRPITNIYSRDYREQERTCCELKAGLAIIVGGYENGKY